MDQGSLERRSEFRFPLMLPVEYFSPNQSSVLSYSLDLAKSGTFISSDDPFSIGSRFNMHFTIPIDKKSSKIFRTEGTVTWSKAQFFRSKNNGMGVRFEHQLPEMLLLHALTVDVRKLIRENEGKKVLEERLDRLESELEGVKSLAALGSGVEKVLFELANPILTLSGKMELIENKMLQHKRLFEENETSRDEKLEQAADDFDYCFKEIDHILSDYRRISELARIGGDERETLEEKLKRYH